MTLRTTFLGRIVTPDRQPLDGLTPLGPLPPMVSQADLPQPSRPVNQLETGVKVLDLGAPLREGGLHQVMGGRGMGKDVLLAELIYNVAHHHQGCAVWVAGAEQQAEGHHMVQAFRECNVLQHVVFVIAPPNRAVAGLQTGRTLAQALAQDGSLVLMGIEDELIQDGTESQVPAHDLATRLIISHDLNEHSLPASLLTDATIVLSGALAEQRLYPAVDLGRSRSVLLERAELADEHCRLADTVRRTLLDQTQTRRAHLLQLFCTQPFFVAEPYTAQPGAYVLLPETLRGFAAILAGTYDDVPDELLTFQGSLPPHP